MNTKLFIKENKEELTECIRKALDRPNEQITTKDCIDWIMNDEGLYNWARSEGVKI